MRVVSQEVRATDLRASWLVFIRGNWRKVLAVAPSPTAGYVLVQVPDLGWLELMWDCWVPVKYAV